MNVFQAKLKLCLLEWEITTDFLVRTPQESTGIVRKSMNYSKMGWISRILIIKRENGWIL